MINRSNPFEAHGGTAAAKPERDAAAVPQVALLPAKKVVTLRIPGKPQPGGSKRAFTPKGWTRPIITDDNPKAADWKRTVQAFAAQAMEGQSVLQGALVVRVVFVLSRPQGHFGSKGLRPSAPKWPTVKPDVLKLMRSTEDALTGLVWRDDAQIINEQIQKAYSAEGWTGAIVEVEEIG